MREISVPASSRTRQFIDAVLNSEYDEVGFGGARGGAKTWSSACTASLIALQHPGTKVLLIRKGLASAKQNFRDELNKVHRMLDIGKGVRYYKSESLYQYLNGSMIHFGYCGSENDFEQYQGLQFAAMGFEEGTQMTLNSYTAMIGSNRSAQFGGRSWRWLTCNPGGDGHDWVYNRFVDPLTRRKGSHWIQSLVTDNPAMMLNDPHYIEKTLGGLPLWRRKQWLEGDWNAMAGQFWDIPPHCLTTEPPPPYAAWYAGVDWGRARPFAVVYVAFWTVWLENPLTKQYDPFDRVHVARVIYQRDLDLDQQAELVASNEADMNIIDKRCVYYADPSTGKRLEGRNIEVGETIRKAWADSGFYTHPARTNARIGGWQLIKRLIRTGALTIDPEAAKPLLSEMNRHVYEGSPGPPTGEDLKQGVDVMDDASDALRYVIVSISGLRAPEKPISHYEQRGQ